MRQATYAIVLLRLSGLCLGGVAGSVLGFVGDSITQNDYSKDVQVFLATRYPGRDLWTCGRSAARPSAGVEDLPVALHPHPW